MNRKLIYIGFIALTFGFVNAISPQSKKITKAFFPDFDIPINTPAFQKEKGFTTYQEMMDFLREIEKKHPNLVTISFIGESQKGNKIPLVKLKRGDNEKIKVWMQGGLHGDEPASTEGVLYLIDQLTNNLQYQYLLEKLEIAFVPMANIDGFEKQDRYAANGLDLNRDQTKLMAPETVALKKAYSAFGAHVSVDFHEYRPYRKDFAQLSDFGITSRYDVMFLYSGNLNVPQNLRDFTRNTFIREAEQLMDSNGLSHHDYVTTVDILGETQFNQGSNNARSSATNCALTNTISSLIEVRGVGLGRTSFNRRVYTTYLVGLSQLKTAFNRMGEVKREIEIAQKSERAVVVESKKTVSKQPLTVIDLNTCKALDLNVIIRDALKSIPIITRKRPTAYLIDSSAAHLVEKLRILGIVVNELPSAKEIPVESYTVVNYLQEANKYEGVNRQEVSTKLEVENRAFGKGSYVVYLHQPNANLAIELLEPEAPNSFITFNQLTTALGQKLPIYRYLNKEKI